MGVRDRVCVMEPECVTRRVWCLRRLPIVFMLHGCGFVRLIVIDCAIVCLCVCFLCTSALLDL